MFKDQMCYETTEKKTMTFLFCQFLIFVLVLRMTVFMRQRFVGDYAVVDIYNIINIAITFMFIIILLLMLQGLIFALCNCGMAVKCIVAYYLICSLVGLLSMSPAYAIYRCVEYLSCFWIIMLLVNRYKSFFRAERIVIFWMNVILLVEFAGHVKFSGWGNFHTNRYSITAAILFIYSFGELLLATGKRRKMLLISTVISFCFVLLGTSTGSNIAIAVGMAFIFLFSPMHRKYMFIIAPFLILMVGMNSVIDLVFAGKSTEDVVNLQHRFDIWQVSWELFTKHPFLGYGLNVATRQYNTFLSSHNSYLEALLAGGILGSGVLFLGCIFLIKSTWNSFRCNTCGSLGCFTVVIVFLINGISAPTIGYVMMVHNVTFSFILALFIYHVRYSYGNADNIQKVLSSKSLWMPQVNIYK